MNATSTNFTENNLSEEKDFPPATLTAISFDISTTEEKEKLSVLEIESTNEVINPKLGIPNPSYQCTTCGAKDYKSCEGHFGVIKFPNGVVHPYFMSEVVQILNKVCPGCKSIFRESPLKGADSSKRNKRVGCKYCSGNSRSWYPRMKFKVSSQETYKKATIIAEVSEKLPVTSQKKGVRVKVASDYWDVIPKDEQDEENVVRPNKRVLTQLQIHHLLKDINPQFIKKFISKADSIFISSFSVTPNCHRVSEVTHAFSNGQKLIFDERTRAYRKLVDFRGPGNELSFRVLDCLRTCKINPEKAVNDDYYAPLAKKSTDPGVTSGLRWIKDVVLGKRNDHSFRMVVIGDPNLKLNEIGIPCHIAERLQISEHLTSWNWEKLNTCCEVQLLQKGQILVRREGNLVRFRRIKELCNGDIIYRSLQDGDTVLINRPPSIHQHSLIALSVKLLPVAAALSINPLCCSPFRGDFDGDCLHGYVSQSVESRVELSEIIALDKQLTNLQSGRNLLSLCQDSLTAAHLLLGDEVALGLFQMQQLQMHCPRKFFVPAILKAPSINGCVWTGKQLISTLLPRDFSHDDPSNNVCIRDGEILSSEGSFWLCESDDNLFESLVKNCHGEFLDLLYAAQEVLCDWLSSRGLSVSLSDLYLCDSTSRKNMMDDIFYGLQEAEVACNLQQFLVGSNLDFLIGDDEEDGIGFFPDAKNLCFERQRSAALSQSSLDAFKQVFRDIQSLAYRYAQKDNAFTIMMKAGSKGNQQKLVQHSMCLGIQHSLVPLSFRMPHKLSCAAWSSQKFKDSVKLANRYIPSAVVRNSFLTGLNPLECFIHSVTSRESSFSDNADIPGSLTRKLMFFFRDLYAAYDGTVRNTYGNLLIQFSYGNLKDSSQDEDRKTVNSCVGIAGQGVGTLAACALSEAAYSALDQPISLLEKSPLLSLKNIIECGTKRNSSKQTMSLFLSKRLARERHGFEYAALEVQNHLEKLLFSDIVSLTRIMFSPRTVGKKHFSPWVCHFHVYKEILRKRKIKISSVIEALYKRCKAKNGLPNVEIFYKNCSIADNEKEKRETVCITVSIIESTKNSSTPLETVRDLLIPFLLEMVLKGLKQIKKVDILWNDKPKIPQLHKKSYGELYLKVYMSGNSGKTEFWKMLVNECIPIMDMIDWTRSHPDNIHDFCVAYGLDAGWKLFVKNLEAPISDIGKTILPEHLLLVADCLSVTGEFVGLNAKGLKLQRQHVSVVAPFVQACLTNPGRSFIKAAKAGVRDSLLGSLDALSWGKTPPIGTGHFDIFYSTKNNHISKTGDVYSLLASSFVSDKQDSKSERSSWMPTYNSDKCGSEFDGFAVKEFKTMKNIKKSFLRSILTYDDILRLSRKLRGILNRYSVDEKLNETDKSLVNFAFYFHPHRDEKIGSGAIDYKVINHPEHQETRCFSLVKVDGTTEDFSYRKCVLSALEIIAPEKARGYRERYLHGRALS